MPGGFKTAVWNRMRKTASEKARRMARRRWAIDRQRRIALAALTVEQYPHDIIRRIVVIDREATVRETCIYSWDSVRSAKAKLRKILST